MVREPLGKSTDVVSFRVRGHDRGYDRLAWPLHISREWHTRLVVFPVYRRRSPFYFLWKYEHEAKHYDTFHRSLQGVRTKFAR